MSKQDDLFNRIKSKKTAAATFRESMESEAASQNKNTSVSDNESKNGSVNESDIGNENTSVSDAVNKSVLENIDVSRIASKRPKKPKFEELHKKDNVWIKNELYEVLNALTKGNKGEKTRIINEALLLYFQKQSEEA